MEEELTPPTDTEEVTPPAEEGTPKEPEVKPEAKTDETPKAPEWLDTKKYGTDIPTAIEKQAQAYHEAEKRMYQAINDGNSTRKEIAAMKATLESLKAGLNVQPSLDANNISEEFRLQVQREFGDSVTAEQVIMQQKLLDANLKSIKETVLESKWDKIEAKLEKDPLFTEYPELMERVEALPLSERLDMNNIKRIKSEFLDEKLPDILEKAKLEGAKSVVTKPAKGQTTETTSKPDKPVAKKIVLSAEQREYIASHGGDPDDTEKYLNRDTKVKVGYLNFAD